MVALISLPGFNWSGLGTRWGMLLSLDLHQAFASPSLPFLFHLLWRWNFGSKFLSLLCVLYSISSANIVDFGCKSDLLQIRTGNRQGCPLSPLIFVVSIETLVVAIRSNPNLHGISSRGRNVLYLWIISFYLSWTLSRPCLTYFHLCPTLVLFRVWWATNLKWRHWTLTFLHPLWL